MKKRKTYEISVIDKTYSKTISDETKFYTSDTALELVFKLKETEYTFESAEIVLLNIDDRSLVTRPVDKVLDSFAYELDDDITAHYGEWRGQLRFEQAGETYVSSPVKFRIENDLGNERPPQLSDVQSWVRLKRYADGLVDELKQAVLSIEGIEDTFNANETIRQSQFDSAEQSRQATFETNESERDRTFESNETTRQSQELEREKAESQRQTVFDDNEASRTKTFNTNEATRQENESVRQQAESGRQSDEIVRVENENKRVLNYENMQETIDSIGKIKIINLVKNGDFSNGVNGWFGNVNYVTSDEYVSQPNSYFKHNSSNDIRQDITAPSNDTLYVSAYIKSLKPTRLRINHFGTFNAIKFTTFSKVGEWSLLSEIVTTHTNGIRANPEAGVDWGVYFDDAIVINLTSTFGAGNEPSKTTMDWIIKENGYFEELTLRRDDIQQYEINQLRKAVIALGGTI